MRLPLTMHTWPQLSSILGRTEDGGLVKEARPQSTTTTRALKFKPSALN